MSGIYEIRVRELSGIKYRTPSNRLKKWRPMIYSTMILLEKVNGNVFI